MKTKGNEKRRIVELPALYKYQEEISQHPARFKVLAIGRRAGKSFLAKIEALERAINQGQNVWLVYPSYNTASTHWREILRMIGDAPFVSYRNQQLKLIEFSTGGSISIKSGDRPENLRGSGLDFVVLDEAAFMKSEVFYEVILPALADKVGDVLIISTPYGKNWFYDVFRIGKDPNEEKWMSWQMKSTVNPLITQEEYNTQKKIIPRMKFLREWDASFEGSGGGVFVNLEEASHLVMQNKPIPGEVYIMGIDWGRSNDYTVITVFTKDGKQRYIKRFTDIGYIIQSKYVLEEIKRWLPKRVFIETNSIGNVMFELLKADLKKEAAKDSEFAKHKIKLTGVYMTNLTKRTLVENYAGWIEHGHIKLVNGSTPEGDAQISEHTQFLLKRTASGQEITYSAAHNAHDDTVMANVVASKGLRFKTKWASKFMSETNPLY